MNEKAERLDKTSAGYIQDHWEYANTIKDPEFFDRRMESGFFYGIVLGGEVVSFVGSLSETEKTVVLGMFFTRPEFRGKHYGLSCASAASEAILESNRIPVCYVESDNKPSRKIWERLGYQKKPQNYYFITVKSQ
jgi:predicted GNAT family acetyltransferase